MPATYEPIATTTLGSAAASITFSSIPSTYTDLRLVVANMTGSTAGSSVFLRFNTDTASNYSFTNLYGDGASPYSVASVNQTQIFAGSYSTGLSLTVPSFVMADVFSYAGSTNKTTLITYSGDFNGTGSTERIVGLWRSTAAITSIIFRPGSYNLNAGTTATLYGIKNA